MTAKRAYNADSEVRTSFGRKKPLVKDDKIGAEITVPGLSNDNDHHKAAPDWSIFSIGKFHKTLGKVQLVLSFMGLLVGLYFAFSSTSTAAPVSLTTIVFSYLNYGLIGAVSGYFSLWIIGAAVIVSPVALLSLLIL